MRIIDIMKDFNDWLIQTKGLKTNSAKSYSGTYMNGVIKEVDEYTFAQKGIKIFGEDIVVSRPSKNKWNRNLFILAKYILRQDIENAKTTKSVPEHTIENRQTALSRFYEFFPQKYHFDNNTVSKILSVKECNQILAGFSGISFLYDNHEIVRIFKSRLTTQERAYEHILFPTSLIGQMMNKDRRFKAKYNKIIDDSIREMALYIDGKGTSIKIKDIQSLHFQPVNGKVFANMKSSGVCHQIFTEAPDKSGNFSGRNFEPMEAIDIDEVSIDHAVPLKKIIEENYSSYPGLLNLSKQVADLEGCCGSDYRAMEAGKISLKQASKNQAGKLIPMLTNADPNITEKVFPDVEEIYKQIDFVGMLRSYNSKKNDD